MQFTLWFHCKHCYFFFINYTGELEIFVYIPTLYYRIAIICLRLFIKII